ncbi:MAG: hypothetical protein K0R38_6548 [Polyangiaceae bacterium]|jgi:hypothetical protein|nr:hypothetical protein [Polyangiaceae bacterium]
MSEDTPAEPAVFQESLYDGYEAEGADSLEHCFGNDATPIALSLERPAVPLGQLGQEQ